MQLSRNHLAAAVEAAAKDDIRPYLNGVLVERFVCGRIRYTATNGHVCFSCWDDSEREPKSAGGFEPDSFIIPTRVVQEILRTVRESGRFDLVERVTSSSDELRAFIFEGCPFVEVDELYLDFTRLFPNKTSGEPGHYSPEYLRVLERAFMRLAGKKGQPKPGMASYELLQNGKSAALAVGKTDDALAVIMPIRPAFNDASERAAAILASGFKYISSGKETK